MAKETLQVNASTNTRVVQRQFGEILTQIPESNSKQTWRISKVFKRMIERSIRRRFTQRGYSAGKSLFDSVYLRSIESTQENESRFQVFIDAPIPYGRDGDYAAWHEFAKHGHFVPFDGRNGTTQPIERFAINEGLISLGRPDSQLGGLHVQPKNVREGSFMQTPVQRASQRTRDIIKDGGDIRKLFQDVFG